MLRKLSLLLIVCLILPAGLATAQQGQMMLVYDETVKPGEIDAYVENSKKFFRMLVDRAPDAEWNAVMTEDLHFLYAIPIESHADIDGMHAMMQEMAMEMGPEKFLAWMEESGKTVDHTDGMVVLRRDDLSYHPDTMIPIEETTVLEYNFYYLKPGMEFAVEQLARDYIAMMKKKGAEGGFTFYQLLLGQGMPAIAVVIPARSPEDLAAQNAMHQKKMGAEGEALQKRSMQLIRSYERKIGWIRPDLSSGAFAKAKE